MQMAADKKEMDQAKAGSNFAATLPVVLYILAGFSSIFEW